MFYTIVALQLGFFFCVDGWLAIEVFSFNVNRPIFLSLLVSSHITLRLYDLGLMALLNLSCP